jgi:hypothetical protein
VEKYGEASREFALNFDWDNIVETYWVPLLENLAADIKTK